MKSVDMMNNHIHERTRQHHKVWNLFFFKTILHSVEKFPNTYEPFRLLQPTEYNNKSVMEPWTTPVDGTLTYNTRKVLYAEQKNLTRNYVAFGFEESNVLTHELLNRTQTNNFGLPN